MSFVGWRRDVNRVCNRRTGFRRGILTLLMFVVVCFTLVPRAQAQGLLIPVVERRDHVFGPADGILYISTSSGKIERYDLVRGRLLEPWNVGNSLNGLDITADGSALYVAEGQRGATQGFVRKVAVPAGSATTITYDLDFGEGGAWDVAIGPGTKGLVTTMFEGSGWVPLRELDLETDNLVVRADAPGSGFGGEVRQNTLVSRGGDRSLFLLGESNISSGPIFTYDAVLDTFPASNTTGAFLGDALSSVNRDGSLMALELFNGISLLNSDLGPVDGISDLNGGLVFDPVLDVLYAVDPASDEIVTIDSNTLQELSRLSIGENVGASLAFDDGVMSISPGGQVIALSTPGGVRLFGAPSTGPLAIIEVIGEPNPVEVGAEFSLLLSLRNPGAAFDSIFLLALITTRDVIPLAVVPVPIPAGLDFVNFPFTSFAYPDIPASGWLVALFDASTGDLVDADLDIVDVRQAAGDRGEIAGAAAEFVMALTLADRDVNGDGR